MVRPNRAEKVLNSDLFAGDARDVARALIGMLLLRYGASYLEARHSHFLVRCGGSFWDCDYIGAGRIGDSLATSNLEMLFLPCGLVEVVIRNVGPYSVVGPEGTWIEQLCGKESEARRMPGGGPP